MKLNREIYRHINREFSVIYHSLSGGMDSTYSLLRLLEEPNLKVKIIPLYNNTGLNLKSAKETINKVNNFLSISGKIQNFRAEKVRIINYDDYLEKTRYSNKNALEIVKDSFNYIEKAEKLLEQGKYSKKVFPCCYYLKERPLIQFSKNTSKNALFTSSIRPGEGSNRQLTLRKFRIEKRYFNFDKKMKRWRFYPLRDTKFKEVHEYLIKHNIFWDTKSSGCKICPVLKLFNFKRKF